jgi:hypothetical protein
MSKLERIKETLDKQQQTNTWLSKLQWLLYTNTECSILQIHINCNHY